MNINKVLLGIIVVLLVVLVILAAWRFIGSDDNFYAVYLATGDLYFGKLTKFPTYGLKQVYLFQVDPQNQEQPINIQRFNQTFWGPEDFIQINRDMVAWKTKLDSQGQLVQLIRENPELVPMGMPQEGMQQQLPQGEMFQQGEIPSFE